MSGSTHRSPPLSTRPWRSSQADNAEDDELKPSEALPYSTVTTGGAAQGSVRSVKVQRDGATLAHRLRHGVHISLPRLTRSIEEGRAAGPMVACNTQNGPAPCRIGQGRRAFGRVRTGGQRTVSTSPRRACRGRTRTVRPQLPGRAQRQGSCGNVDHGLVLRCESCAGRRTTTEHSTDHRRGSCRLPGCPRRGPGRAPRPPCR